MLSTSDLYEHKWRRKLWERGFGTLQLRDYEPRVLHHLDVLISQLHRRVGSKAISALTWLSRLTRFSYTELDTLV